MRVFLLLLLATTTAADSVDDLLDKADGDSWAERWAAVQGLVRMPVGDHYFKLRAALLRDPRPRVREAIAWACSLDADLAPSALLGIVVKKDAVPAVRRAAARALGLHRDRRAVSALIEALAGETDTRTRLHIIDSLRALTPAPCLMDPAAWSAWWKEHAHDPRFAPADEAAKKGEYEGIVLETKTVAAVRKKGKQLRPPPHMLVLPGFGYSTAIYGPYLLPLRRLAAMTWVSLPGVQKLTGRSGYGSDIGNYPVERLVKALDAFRASLKLSRFVLLAPGAGGWIAMRYAQRYPERCAGLILIDTALDKKAYIAALQRGAARGTKGERYTAKTLMRQNNVPFSRGTLDYIHRLGIERGFSDRADLEIGHFFHRAREPQGFASVPEIKWRKRARLDVPTIFFYSASSAFSRHMDANRIQKHFPRSLVAPLKNARGLPWVEENKKLHAVVADWLKRFDLID